MRRCGATWEVVRVEEGNESGRDGRVMIAWPPMTRWRRAAIQSSADDLCQCAYVTKREMCEKRLLLLVKIYCIFRLHVLMPTVYCCRWSCSLQSENYSKLYYFYTIFLEWGRPARIKFEGKVTSRRQWSGLLVAGFAPKQIISTCCEKLHCFHQKSVDMK